MARESDLIGQQITGQAVSAEDVADVLLETVRQLAAELHRRSSGEIPAMLDSSLERDLGFDSLGRVELLARIERALTAQQQSDGRDDQLRARVREAVAELDQLIRESANG